MVYIKLKADNRLGSTVIINGVSLHTDAWTPVESATVLEMFKQSNSMELVSLIEIKGELDVPTKEVEVVPNMQVKNLFHEEAVVTNETMEELVETEEGVEESGENSTQPKKRTKRKVANES